MAVGFGSGSTSEEFSLFGLAETGEVERHARFEDSLRLVCSAWSKDGFERGSGADLESSVRFFSAPRSQSLPVPADDLARRCWVAVNSVGSARIAGALNFTCCSLTFELQSKIPNMPLSTEEQGVKDCWRQTGLSLSPPMMKPDERRDATPATADGERSETVGVRA
jgi:hypothetical protein